MGEIRALSHVSWELRDAVGCVRSLRVLFSPRYCCKRRGDDHRLLHPSRRQLRFLCSGSSSVKLFLFKNGGSKASGKRDIS